MFRLTLYTDLYFQWDLICDKDNIAYIITTIQMTGLFIAGITSGHVSDGIGRKPSFFLSILIMVVFNIACALSVSWQMFAIMRFFLGIGIGGYLTIFYTYLSEFIPNKHRPLVMSVPSWSIWAAILGGFAKWLHNWVYLHYATAILTAPWLIFYW